MNNLATKYLSELLMIRKPKLQSVRLDNDFFLLDQTFANYKKTNAAFSVSAPIIWNELPYALRSLTTLMKFKSELKTYFFNIAYMGVE